MQTNSNETMQNPFAFCNLPWTTLRLHYQHIFSPCCRIPEFTCEDGAQTSIPEMWNSLRMQQLRKQLAAGTFPEGSPCNLCTSQGYLADDLERFKQSPSCYFDFLSDVQSEQKENTLRAFEAFKNKKSQLTSLPVVYEILFGSFCNIRCTMCNYHTHEAPKGSGFSQQWIEKNLEYFATACQLTILGGEVFAIPSALDFLAMYLASGRLEHVGLTILTNGSLLAPYIDRLAEKNVTLGVSLDGCGEQYERIRRGGSWEVVAANMERFAAAKRTGAIHKYLRVAYLVMRSTVQGLGSFVEWAVDHGYGLVFSRVVSMYPLSPEGALENIYACPDLLYTVPHWQNHFEAAIHRLEDAAKFSPHYTQPANVLTRLYQSLSSASVRSSAIGRYS